MELTKEQRERYARHLLIRDIGTQGQEKLAEGSVLVIGTGGLGSPAALYLTAAGVGRVGIADADVVDLSNLQRQVLHGTPDLGRPKVDSAEETLHALNPEVKIEKFGEYVTADNIMTLVGKYDFVLDCTDNFPTKFLINDACVLADKPFVHAGIYEFSGQLMTVLPHQTPCYRCIFGTEPPKDAFPNGGVPGVVGAVAGVIGSLEALEAIKFLTGAGQLLAGSLLTFDGRTMKFRTVKLPPRGDGCAVCADHPEIVLPGWAHVD